MAHSDFVKLLGDQLAFWQKTLKLQDWDIKISFWPHAALNGEVCHITWLRDQKTASLAMRMPEDIPPIERDWPEGEAADYDISLVHELLHLKCVDLESEVEWAEEQLANHLSRALVSLYRNGHPATAIEEVEETEPSKGIEPTLGGHYL